VQLNVYLPKAKAALLDRLDEAAKRTGKPKNELVVEAIEAYLGSLPPVFGTYQLGVVASSRAELYDDALNRRFPHA
jgi:hypothetical protein